MASSQRNLRTYGTHCIKILLSPIRRVLKITLDLHPSTLILKFTFYIHVIFIVQYFRKKNKVFTTWFWLLQIRNYFYFLEGGIRGLIISKGSIQFQVYNMGTLNLYFLAAGKTSSNQNWFRTNFKGHLNYPLFLNRFNFIILYIQFPFSYF